METNTKAIRAGDTVLHEPSGETWVVAWASGREAIPCGWPETVAPLEDCVLLTVCSDRAHINMLRQVAGDPRNNAPRSMKSDRAYEALVELGDPAYIEARKRALESQVAETARLLIIQRAQLQRVEEIEARTAGIDLFGPRSNTLCSKG